MGDEAASSGSYFVGWLVSGYCYGVGDVRDTVETIYQQDAIGTGLNAFGIIPFLGDGEKSIKNIGKIVIKYPEKLVVFGKFISKELLPNVPYREVRVRVLNTLYDNKAGKLIAGQVTDAHLISLSQRGIDLTKVRHVVALDSGKAIPVLEESVVHYEGRHVMGTIEVGEPGTTLFPSSKQVVWNGEVYPGKTSVTQDEIKAVLPDWIDRAVKAKGWTDWPEQAKPAKLTLSDAEITKYGIREIEVSINANNGVASIFPLNGPQVYKWYSGKWNAMP